MTPLLIKNKKTNEGTLVPCGKCPDCLQKRASGWSFRLMQEERVSSSAFFLTLTYDTNHVPITQNGFMSLSKRHVQLFFKRLRKAHGNHHTLKYYAVGEYGGKTFRPHYHIILFNARIELVQPAWDLGQIHYGDVSGASVGYTMKYISKTKRIPLHRNDDRTPEFGLMSKKLGSNYLSDPMLQWHKADLENRMYVNVDGDKKAAMPRYYKDRIYTEEERKCISVFAKEKMWVEKSKEWDMDQEVLSRLQRDRLQGIEAAKNRLERDTLKGNKI